MDIFLIVLRLLHIFAGVFWAGAVLMLYGFVEPTINALGPDGGKFMQHLMLRTRFSMTLSVAALLTTLAGLVLFWRESGGLAIAWIVSPAGLGYTISGLAGIVVFVMGFAINAPTANRIGALGKEMQSAGAPPTSAQLSEMQALQKKLHDAGILGAVLLAIAVIGMAVARYL